jgi:hypothetical protein
MVMQKTIPSNLLDPEFQRIFKETADRVKYMKPALMSIRDDWYRENRTLFKLRGPGKFTDLKDSTKRQKIRAAADGKITGLTRPPYPILLARNGRIQSGLTDKASQYTVNEVTDTSLTVGIKGEDYFLYQQKGTTRMARHPFIFKSRADGDDQWTNQRDRWVKILLGYQARRLAAMGGV